MCSRLIVTETIGHKCSFILAFRISHGIVLKSGIPHFVIFGRTCHKLIVWNSTRVGTPLCVNSNVTFAYLTRLGSDDDDTIGTTGTIKSRRRSILQYCHTFNIRRVNRVDIAIVWRTVNYDKRIVTSIDRADTTYTDSRSRTRSTRSFYHLHTSGLTFQSINNVGYLNLTNLFCAYNSSRTSKGTLLLSTVSNNHHLIQSVIICIQNNLHVLASLY